MSRGAHQLTRGQGSARDAAPNPNNQDLGLKQVMLASRCQRVGKVDPTSRSKSDSKRINSDLIPGVAGGAGKKSTAVNRNFKFLTTSAENYSAQGRQAKTPTSSIEIRNSNEAPSESIISEFKDEPENGIGSPTPCKYSKGQVQLLADSQYFAEQGPEQNFMDISTPSDRQEGFPTEPKVKFTGSRGKAANEGHNAKECDRYDTDVRLRKGKTGGVHGNKTSLNNGSAAPRVAQGKVAGSATGVQRTLHGRLTRSQGLLEQTPIGMSTTPHPPANILVSQSKKSYGAKNTTEKNNSDAGRLKDFPADKAPSKYMTTSTGRKERRPPVHRAGGDRHPPEGLHGANRTLHTSTAKPELEMIQGEEEFLSHGRIFGAKSEVDRATRCARRARMQEMANDPIIKENLYGESDVPDLTPSDDEGEKPVAGPGAYSGTDDASQVQDRVSSSDKHCKQSLAKTGATHAPGAAPQGPVDPDRRSSSRTSNPLPLYKPETSLRAEDNEKGDSVTSGGAEGAISGEVMTHRQARESSTSTDISVTKPRKDSERGLASTAPEQEPQVVVPAQHRRDSRHPSRSSTPSLHGKPTMLCRAVDNETGGNVIKVPTLGTATAQRKARRPEQASPEPDSELHIVDLDGIVWVTSKAESALKVRGRRSRTSSQSNSSGSGSDAYPLVSNST
jgi:hypothetical protein